MPERGELNTDALSILSHVEVEGIGSLQEASDVASALGDLIADLDRKEKTNKLVAAINGT
jgi:hypothetical protein